MKAVMLAALICVASWGASLFELGKEAYVNGNYEEALEYFAKAIKEKPKSAEIYYERGCLLSDLGEYEAAIKDFTKAIELKPDYGFAYNNRAISYGTSGDIEKAEKDARKACELKVCVAYQFMRENGFIED
ncbi:MAG: tetratricopeptide repeat protein [Helicobacteraceae bacterium]|jgi:Flp pilus assembly protein TadD|nr:tetratricopeptide repeat protein [Helicobacteraceae bacterium]